eukprot:11429-Heterococcus_DN1.PRE.1
MRMVSSSYKPYAATETACELTRAHCCNACAKLKLRPAGVCNKIQLLLQRERAGLWGRTEGREDYSLCCSLQR